MKFVEYNQIDKINRWEIIRGIAITYNPSFWDDQSYLYSFSRFETTRMVDNDYFHFLFAWQLRFTVLSCSPNNMRSETPTMSFFHGDRRGAPAENQIQVAEECPLPTDLPAHLVSYSKDYLI